MDLRDVQKNWNEFGKRDPLWAILTVPEFQDGKWDAVEFFRRGEREIEALMHYLDRLGLAPVRGRALDFGCGVGRLTQALGQHFDECIGVDIAPSMIEKAQQYNRLGERCRYLLNESDDLRCFKDNSFDLIYSVIVLQHVAPLYSCKYIQEFVRVLAPRGALVFQLPSELAPVTLTPTATPPVDTPARRRNMLQRVYMRLKSRLSRMNAPPASASLEPAMEMHAVPRDEVVALIERCGGRVVDIQRDEWAGLAWISYTYGVTK